MQLWSPLSLCSGHQSEGKDLIIELGVRKKGRLNNSRSSWDFLTRWVVIACRKKQHRNIASIYKKRVKKKKTTHGKAIGSPSIITCVKFQRASWNASLLLEWLKKRMKQDAYFCSLYWELCKAHVLWHHHKTRVWIILHVLCHFLVFGFFRTSIKRLI